MSFSVAGPEFFPEAEMRQQVSGGSGVRGPEDGPDGGPDHVVVGPLPERGQRVQRCPVCYYNRAKLFYYQKTFFVGEAILGLLPVNAR